MVWKKINIICYKKNLFWYFQIKIIYLTTCILILKSLFLSFLIENWKHLHSDLRFSVAKNQVIILKFKLNIKHFFIKIFCSPHSIYLKIFSMVSLNLSKVYLFLTQFFHIYIKTSFLIKFCLIQLIYYFRPSITHI